jgi:hypothetical protein
VGLLGGDDGHSAAIERASVGGRSRRPAASEKGRAEDEQPPSHAGCWLPPGLGLSHGLPPFRPTPLALGHRCRLAGGTLRSDRSLADPAHTTVAGRQLSGAVGSHHGANGVGGFPARSWSHPRACEEGAGWLASVVVAWSGMWPMTWVPSVGTEETRSVPASASTRRSCAAARFPRLRRGRSRDRCRSRRAPASPIECRGARTPVRRRRRRSELPLCDQPRFVGIPETQRPTLLLSRAFRARTAGGPTMAW